MFSSSLHRPNFFLHLSVIVFVISLNSVQTIKWLSLLRTASIGTIDSAELCPNLEGLTRRQIKICIRNVEVMDSVRFGAEQAVIECQWQFKYRRWNCSTINGTRLFGKTVMEGTRESAFVHAISSAGVSHAVTRACSSGRLVRCGCDRTVQKSPADSFKWSGCSDNIAYGTAFSKSFVDTNDIRQARGKSDPKAIMNLHNNEAGRKAIEYQMRIECKCHGASGSCQTKTCWRAMPEFRMIGSDLKNRFDAATEVRPKKMGKRTKLAPVSNVFKPFTDVDLIYLKSSPDFCEPNDKIGSLGTHGRECNKTSRDVDGCELLCCGRGYSRHLQNVVERCHCKFHWCCHVTCKECKSETETYECL
ncbi:protein Wnt-4-like [Stegodyphus dumicola]|uniref:protein Wnt-4-like n=1 Tax=Stegodyphus dumicola TaxID=202533 RepID=UPI0015B0E5B4|nr:protein Wnt-4-like [Stegodyphus dumicola]